MYNFLLVFYTIKLFTFLFFLLIFYMTVYSIKRLTYFNTAIYNIFGVYRRIWKRFVYHIFIWRLILHLLFSLFYMTVYITLVFLFILYDGWYYTCFFIYFIWRLILHLFFSLFYMTVYITLVFLFILYDGWYVLTLYVPFDVWLVFLTTIGGYYILLMFTHQSDWSGGQWLEGWFWRLPHGKWKWPYGDGILFYKDSMGRNIQRGCRFIHGGYIHFIHIIIGSYPRITNYIWRDCCRICFHYCSKPFPEWHNYYKKGNKWRMFIKNLYNSLFLYINHQRREVMS